MEFHQKMEKSCACQPCHILHQLQQWLAQADDEKGTAYE